MNYRRAPSDVYDDAEEMQRWVSVSRRGRAPARGEEAAEARAAANARAISGLSSIELRKRGVDDAVRGLLIGIAEREDAGIVPAGADEGEADRQAAHLRPSAR